MRLQAEDNQVVLENVFAGVLLRTESKEEFGICMRDGGFEFHYGGKWYEAKNGQVNEFQKTAPADPEDFWVECSVCHGQFKNWSGSTSCCGALAFLVDDNGRPTKTMSLYASVGDGPVEPVFVGKDPTPLPQSTDFPNSK